MRGITNSGIVVSVSLICSIGCATVTSVPAPSAAQQPPVKASESSLGLTIVAGVALAVQVAALAEIVRQLPARPYGPSRPCNCDFDSICPC
jgi:hypothetical protein